MTIRQLHRLKFLLNLRALTDEAGLSYEALAAKLSRYGQGRKSELSAPEGIAIEKALARLFGSAGYTLSRPSLSDDVMGESR